MAIFLYISATFIPQQAWGQQGNMDSIRAIAVDSVSDGGGVTYFVPVNIGACKSYELVQYFFGQEKVALLPNGSSAPKNPLFAIHGNYLYEFMYRSHLDTPFAANNFQQHTEQIFADMVYKGRYPFRVSINARQSNSPFFKNYVDANVQFNHYAFNRVIKDAVLADISERLRSRFSQTEVQKELDGLHHQLDSIQNWLSSPERAKEMVEERERMLVAYYGLDAQKKKLLQEIQMLSDSSSQWRQAFEKRALDCVQKEQDNIFAIEKKLTGKADSIMTAMHLDSISPTTAKAKENLEKSKRLLDSTLAWTASEKKKADSFKLKIDRLVSNGGGWRAHFVDSLQHAVLEKDSTAKSLVAAVPETQKKLAKEKMRIDSLLQTIKGWQKKADSLKLLSNQAVASIRDKLTSASSAGQVNELIAVNGGKPLDKNASLLMSITQLGIGRSLLNYSELTVKNISLSGLNVEFKNSRYAALAIGNVDYRFRDFIINPAQQTHQNLFLARYGWINESHQANSIIFTAYTGTKQNYFSGVSNTAPSSSTIMGYGVELKRAIGKNSVITAELVKSSTPYSGNGKGESFGKAFSLSDRSNEACSVKWSLAIPSTHSNITAFYKKTGVNFQSYSVFHSGSRQESWGIKWQQYFWNKQLSITGQLRKNDFDNPLINQNYSSSSTLKMVQAVFRKRKWPVLTFAYMPTTQLTKSPDGSLSENLFYATNASLSHSYRVRNCSMITSLIYNKFNTKGTDSGFVFFGAKDFKLNQDMQFGKIGNHFSFDWYSQPGLTYYTLSQEMDAQLTQNFSLGLGAKDALLKNGSQNWGGTFHAVINFYKLGSFQLQYDKGFLPNYLNGGLVSNDWGRILWTKTF